MQREPTLLNHNFNAVKLKIKTHTHTYDYDDGRLAQFYAQLCSVYGWCVCCFYVCKNCPFWYWMEVYEWRTRVVIDAGKDVVVWCMQNYFIAVDWMQCIAIATEKKQQNG